MTWNWNRRGPMPVQAGGNVGTRAEAGVTQAWPKEEQEYLARKLNAVGNGLQTLPEQAAAAQIQLNAMTENYKEETDECLKREFEDWLQGKHSDNLAPTRYINAPGLPRRRQLERTDPSDPNNSQPGEDIDDWVPTWWGKTSLTHLPGVREYLREQKIRAETSELDMNLLAEFGPQNLDQAWAYFKHWVKRRPISNALCTLNFVDDGWVDDSDINRAMVGNMPTHMPSSDGVRRPGPPFGTTIEGDDQDVVDEVADALNDLGDIGVAQQNGGDAATASAATAVSRRRRAGLMAEALATVGLTSPAWAGAAASSARDVYRNYANARTFSLNVPIENDPFFNVPKNPSFATNTAGAGMNLAAAAASVPKDFNPLTLIRTAKSAKEEREIQREGNQWLLDVINRWTGGTVPPPVDPLPPNIGFSGYGAVPIGGLPRPTPLAITGRG